MHSQVETPAFDYASAFSRNIGWVTRQEQQRLRQASVAVAGLGGVGGSHLLTLARLGIGRFAIADFDRFELHNMNRQAGAFASTLGRPKAEVLAEMIREINPEADVRLFSEGVSPDNASAFLDGMDVYIDGLDYFALDIRQTVFRACRDRRIPAITVAPLGMGAALLNFLPGRMSFDDYFRFDDGPADERPLRFAIGLAPSLLQVPYIADPSAVRLSEQSGPSTSMACELCAGIAATEALKLILGRGKVIAAPRGMHFDAYRGRLRKTWRPLGNRNPVQRLLLAFGRYKLKQFAKERQSRAT
jgi:molybdopterin-synthase adenylyltransferase